ncbi:MAG: cupin domain-containing protein [Chloroflexi bacterium]|nr:cupin domain-containing protein [Chloroflexota bacterium]
MTAPASISPVEERIDRFYADLQAHDLVPLWQVSSDLMRAAPEPRTIPYLWRWATLRRLAEAAGELITIERGGDRRVLSLANPGLEGAPFASSTLWGAVQYLGPRESAPGHRHTPSAIRFVMEGEGVWTTVNGDACDMRAGDLILTPSWCWHDHNNASDRPMIWFDGLDLPTVNALDAVFFEPYEPDELQPVLGHGISERIWGGRSLVPAGVDPAANGHASPLLVYRWADTDAALGALLAERSGPLATITYTHPVNGGPALPTMACEMHRLVPDGRSQPYRKVGSSVYVVFRGSGASIIDGQRFDWSAGDMFVVPSWTTLEHEASEPSDLFAISDRPILEALHLFRDEVLDQPQAVERVFVAKGDA